MRASTTQQIQGAAKMTGRVRARAVMPGKRSRIANQQSIAGYFTICLAMSELSLPTMTRNLLPR